MRFTLLRRSVVYPLLVVAFWVLVWQGLALWVGLDLLLPRPIVVGRTVLDFFGTGAFYRGAVFTLSGILVGFLGGVLIGVLLALLTWASALFDALFSPFLRVIRTVPVASFIILLLLWLSSRAVPMVVAGLMVLPVVWSATKTALDETDVALIEMARAYCFSRGKTLRLVYLPAVLPQFIAAAVTAMGLAWKSGVAAEVIAGPMPALGTNLYRAKLLLDTEALFAWTLIIVVLSFLLERLFVRVMRRLERRYAR